MPIEERKVTQDARSHTVATQPYPVGADRMLPDCDEWRKETIPSGFKLGCFFAPASLDVPNLLTPAWGMRVTPMAYSPQTGLLLRARQRLAAVVPPRGGSRTSSSSAPAACRACRRATASWRRSTAARERSRGRRISPAPRPSGALATASGLLFQTMPDGNLIASDAKTGEQIWQFQTGANGGGGPAVDATRSTASSTSPSACGTT